MGLNRDKYGASAMVVDLSRGLPHAALARVTQSLASDLRAQVFCFNLMEFQFIFFKYLEEFVINMGCRAVCVFFFKKMI